MQPDLGKHVEPGLAGIVQHFDCHLLATACESLVHLSRQNITTEHNEQQANILFSGVRSRGKTTCNNLVHLTTHNVANQDVQQGDCHLWLLKVVFWHKLSLPTVSVQSSTNT